MWNLLVLRGNASVLFTIEGRSSHSYPPYGELLAEFWERTTEWRIPMGRKAVEEAMGDSRGHRAELDFSLIAKTTPPLSVRPLRVPRRYGFVSFRDMLALSRYPLYGRIHWAEILRAQ